MLMKKEPYDEARDAKKKQQQTKKKTARCGLHATEGQKKKIKIK
jgi:hypothetical protein